MPEQMPANPEQPNFDEKQTLLRMSEIGLWLDTYDDIFSDFDPRPYSQRALSDDFLYEAKKASRGKPSGKLELKFLIPEELRNASQENLIKKRLRDHFKKHFDMEKDDYKTIIQKGLIYTAVGVILMMIVSIVVFIQAEKSLLVVFFEILLEPASWFLFWEGLRQVIFEPKSIKQELIFYQKMAICEIKFISY